MRGETSGCDPTSAPTSSPPPCSDATSRCGRFLSWFKPRRARLASSQLERERLLLFCLAKTPLDDRDPEHIKLLDTIFRRFTGFAGAVPRFGSHWEALGFQGQDPATDLRGGGILGLLQLLAVFEHHPPSAKAIHRLSADPRLNFPLSIVSINFTRRAQFGLPDGRAGGTLSDVSPSERFFVGGPWRLRGRGSSTGRPTGMARS